MKDFVTKQTERKAMGLAASQARFLAITSRKANCEFQSMQIAQDKLSVTRDLAKISQEYQDALNATTLVWDFEGQNTYNLSYGMFMTPTMMNDFSPYLLTTRTGAVVLNEQIAKAARLVSPNGAPIERNAAGFAKFMEALGLNGVVPASTVRDITNASNLHYKSSDGTKSFINPSVDDIKQNNLYLDKQYTNGYNKNAGYGATPLNKNGVTASNIIGLSYRLSKYNLKGSSKFSSNVLNNFTDNRDGESAYKIFKDSTNVNAEQAGNITIGDLLSSNVILMYTMPDNKDIDDNGKNANIQAFTDVSKDIFATISEALKDVLGTDVNAIRALNTAIYMVKNTYFTIVKDDVKKSTSGAVDKSVNLSNNNFAMGYVESSGRKHNDSMSINLSNLLSCVLTNMELILNGYDSNYTVGTTPATSNLVTRDPYYNYVMKDDDAVDNDILLKADFYMQIYNNICINGWTENKEIDKDGKYLEQMLKNGNYFISSIAQDGYFYQGRYNESDCIVEVKDEDAIARAEAEFATKKTKLTYKEEKLDMDMKNLDAEISSLTTEYDSVKNLISKNVEKVFTMFQ